MNIYFLVWNLLIIAFLSFNIWSVNCELFVDLISEKNYLSKNITVVHSCPIKFSICVQISYQLDLKHKFFFDKPICQYCSVINKYRKPGQIYKSVLPFHISENLVCPPNYWNHDPIMINLLRLHLFIISNEDLENQTKLSEIRKYALEKETYNLHVPSPYSRKHCLTFNFKSTSFYHDIMNLNYSHRKSPSVQIPIPLANGVFTSDQSMGLYIDIPRKWNNHYFENFIKLYSKRFTISMWIYLNSNCNETFCNILSFFKDSDESFSSPTILLMDSGEIHLQVKLKHSNSDFAFKTSFIIPIRSWIQIILSIDEFQWYLSLFKPGGILLDATTYTKFPSQININITKDFGIIGGSQIYIGVHGFFSDVYLHLGTFGQHQKIHHAIKNPGLALKIDHKTKFEGCTDLLNELELYLIHIRNSLSKKTEKNICPNTFFYKGKENQDTCSSQIHDFKRPKIYYFIKKKIIDKNFHMKKILKLRNINLKKTLLGESLSFNEILTSLQEYISSKVMEKLKIKGIDINSVIVSYLKDAVCLDDPNAMYILALLHFYGIAPVKINTTKTLELLLINVNQHMHRLSLLALGNIYYLQLIPVQKSLAFVFYKAVADLVSKDVENNENKDMYNDDIRLTNEEQIKEHTDEDGDLFEWIKHQASSGIPWAKQKLGRMLYWGSQGVRRNLNMATDFFKMAAEAPEAQPEDHVDYGLILIKNPNQDDIEKGKSELMRASETEPRALTALGWLAEHKEKNISKALDYYKKAYSMGNPDAAFNLGVYYHYGKRNLITQDKALAFHYFEKAAVKNQVDAGSMYSHYMMSGLEKVLEKNITIALNWARYTAERNPKVGYYLSEGVRAFRKKKMELSMLFYFLAAFSGIELANFNIAFLCEENEVIAKKYVEKECIWYHYNLTIQREEQHINPYSLIKLGDKHWYGCLDNQRDVNKSIEFYIRAARKNEPHAYYNLAYILENEEICIPATLRTEIEHICHVSSNRSENWRENAIHKLYHICEELTEDDGYLPCRLASHRLWISKMWSGIKIKIQLLFVIIVTSFVLYKSIQLTRNSQDVNNDNQQLSN